MAPNAFQGASLKENGGADPGSVVNAEFLYIEYRSCHSIPVLTVLPLQYSTTFLIRQAFSKKRLKTVRVS